MRPNLTLLLFTFILSLSIKTVNAQTCTWLGGVGNWNDPTKWSTGTVPGPTNDVVINAGSVSSNWFDAGQTVDTVRIKSLTFSAYMVMQSHMIIDGDLHWASGTIQGQRSYDDATPSGGIIVNGAWYLQGSSNVAQMGLNAVTLSIRNGGTWNNPPKISQLNSAITFELNPTELGLTINTNKRNLLLEGVDTDVNRIRPLINFIAPVVKTGAYDVNVIHHRMDFNGNFQVMDGNFTVSIYNYCNAANAYFYIAEGSRVNLNMAEGWWSNTQIVGPGNLNINAGGGIYGDGRWGMIGNSLVNVDTLNCYNYQEYGEYLYGMGLGRVVSNYMEIFPGAYIIHDIVTKKLKTAEAADIFLAGQGTVIDTAIFSNRTFTGGGTITIEDSVFWDLDPNDQQRWHGINWVLNGNGTMNNPAIPISNGIDFYWHVPAPLNSSFTIAPTGRLNINLTANGAISQCCNISDGEGLPYTVSFLNKGVMNISSPSVLRDMGLNMPFINSGVINVNNVKLNLDTLTWLNGGEIRGNAASSANVAGPFNFSSNGPIAKLVTTKLNLSGSSVFAKGILDIDKSGGVLLNYGGNIDACTTGPVSITNSSGDGRGYFANYGTFIKANGSNVFRSEVTLKNGRNMVINGGTVRAQGDFINLNLVRGHGTLDLSSADNVTNTGTFSGGITLTGTLTINGDYDNHDLLVDIKGDNPGAGPANDKLIVQGNIDLTGSKIIVKERGNAPADTSYIIIEHSGTRNGEFSTFDMPAGYTVVYEDNQVILQKGAGLLLTRTGPATQTAVDLVKTKFKVYRMSGNLYRLQNVNAGDEISIVSTAGTTTKKYIAGNYSTIDLGGLAKGVYIAFNSTTGAQCKFVIY